MAADLGSLGQIALLAGVGFLMFRYGGCCGVPARRPREPQMGERRAAGASAQDPLQALKVRLARGDIDVDEYERLRKKLEL